MPATPENIPYPTPPGTPLAARRPPDFLLPKAESGAGRRRSGKPDVYVSWGGQIYGPSAVDEVINGVRTGYFGDDALFWFEGRDEWRPVAELPGLFEPTGAEAPEAGPPLPRPKEAIRPQWPGPRKRSASSRGERRRSRGRGRGSRAARSKLVGRLIVLLAVLLAVLITAGLLLMISVN